MHVTQAFYHLYLLRLQLSFLVVSLYFIICMFLPPSPPPLTLPPRPSPPLFILTFFVFFLCFLMLLSGYGLDACIPLQGIFKPINHQFLLSRETLLASMSSQNINSYGKIKKLAHCRKILKLLASKSLVYFIISLYSEFVISVRQ